MKVRVSMPGAYMVMEMEEGQAHRTFHKIVELLCVSGTGRKKGEEAVLAITESANLPASTETVPMPVVEAEPEPEEESLEIVENRHEEAGEPVKNISIGYGGFLYIKCPDCGNVKGFCAKARISNFRCDCGSLTKLEHLVPLYLNCECGRNARYLTNMKEPVFDVVCYDCGSPVAVEWNQKKKQYETIRGGAE